MTTSVEIDNVMKHYGSSNALKGVSLDIGPGEFMTLVGPSGCGKSTLLRIIAGLMAQSSGQIRIDGRPVDHLPPKGRDIAMVFQSYALYPHKTVADNIAVPLRVRKMSRAGRLPLIGRFIPGQGAVRREIAEEVRRVADQVEIGALLGRKPAQLSGGQRQRVAVARAIIRDPKVFLMDEPLSNLDARLRVTMRGEITDLHKRLGSTFIYVTHDQTEAMTMSSRVAVMMDGEIVQCASPQQLYDDPEDLRVAKFIGSPEINVISRDEVEALEASDRKGLVASPETRDFAFRAEALTPPGPGCVNLAFRIERHELLGHDVLLYLRTTKRRTSVVARLTAQEFSEFSTDGDVIRMGVSRDKIMSFDAQGHRVRQTTYPAQVSGAVSSVG